MFFTGPSMGLFTPLVFGDFPVDPPSHPVRVAVAAPLPGSPVGQAILDQLIVIHPGPFFADDRHTFDDLRMVAGLGQPAGDAAEQGQVRVAGCWLRIGRFVFFRASGRRRGRKDVCSLC